MTDKKVCIIALDETYGLDDKVKETVGKLFTCYVYDPELSVHCCEITPSFELVPFEFYTERDIDDDLHSTLMAEMSANDQVVYMHCSAVEAIDPQMKTTTTLDLELDENDEDAARMVADLAATELRANVVQPPHAFTL